MATCGCTEHASFSKDKSFKVYKIKAKKHRVLSIKKLTDNGFLDPRVVAVCTACVKYAEEHLSEISEPPQKKVKVTESTVVTDLIDSLNNGKLQNSDVITIATALGKYIQNDILEDTFKVGKEYRDDAYLSSLDLEKYVCQRNQVLLSFLKASANMDSDNRKKMLCIANAIDSTYKARNLSTISPFSFSRNFITYCMTGSKMACDLNNSVSPSGSYTSIRKWMKDKSSDPVKPPKNGDLITFFDNNQVLCRNWRVTYNYKCKVSVITTVLHIVPSPETRLQYTPNLSPFHWLYLQRDPVLLVQSMKEFAKIHLENFTLIQNEFIKDRLRKVMEEQLPTGKDKIDAVMEEEDAVIRNPPLPCKDPYDAAPCAHPNRTPSASLGDPIFVNPCSYNSLDEVFRHLQEQLTRADENDDGRAWTTLGCDGLPYVLGSRLIEDDNTLQNLLLLPGLGHFELNMTRAVFKLLWDVVLEDMAKLLGYKSVRALASCNMCSDHHKAFQMIRILLFGTMDEILLPYVKTCISTSKSPSLRGFFDFLRAANDPNYRFLASVIFSYVLPLWVFRCGVRKNNQRYILAGRVKFSSLYYGLNMSMYQEIDFKDIKMRSLLPDNLSYFMQTNESFSMSGSKIAGEGGDFVLESYNRRIKRMLPPGLPSNADWSRVCRNIAPLEQVYACVLIY